MITTTTFSSPIRERREQLQISRIELARRAGISFSHLSNIEHGAVPRGGQALARIGAALDEAERRVA